MQESHDGMKFNLTTSLILAGIVFVAVLIGGWVTQSRDITSLTTALQLLTVEQKAHATLFQSEQRIQDVKIISSSERLAIAENNLKTVNDLLCEIKKDIKIIRDEQIAFYKSKGFITRPEK